MIPTLPYVAPWYRIARTDGEVVLEYGQRIVCLAGRAGTALIPVMLPLLDGTRTLDEIVEVLGEAARPAIEAALERMDESGLLIGGPPLSGDIPAPIGGTAELFAALHPVRGTLPESHRLLESGRVAVVGTGAAAVEVARLLRLTGVDVRRAETISPEVDLTVCAPSPAELPMLGSWNEQALAAGQAWLQVLPFDGRYAAIGPLYLPGDTACYECFRLRRLANLDAAEELDLLEASPARYPSSPALHALVAGLAASVALRWVALRDHHLPASFHSLELEPVLALSLHHVHRVPRCPVCSGLADVAGPLPWHKEHAAVGH